MSRSRGPSPVPPLPPKGVSTSSSSSSNNHNLKPAVYSSRPSSTYRSNSSQNLQAGYVNQDLAAAVRDSVRIGSSGGATSSNRYPGNTPRSISEDSLDGLSNSNSNYNLQNQQLGSQSQHQQQQSQQTRNIDQRHPTPTRGISSSSSIPPYPVNQGYPLATPLGTELSLGQEMFQPSLPSANLAQHSRNPFEDDELEPPGDGRVKPPSTESVPNRGKIAKSSNA